ncbi:MAG: LytTR family DNA-binding domain-containing protein, partial [Bacteroidota bacterium]
MKPIKVLLVDDEYLALRLLENFIKEVPDLEIIGKEKSPIKALDILNSGQVDLLFLDVQMPTLSGVNLLKTLKQAPLTIFTTAYTDHAISAFDLDAVDYLLKPFSFERFLKAVNKAKTQLHLSTPSSNLPPSPDSQEFMVIRSEAKTTKVFLDQILFIEGLKEYVRIVCQEEKLVMLESLKNLEAQLPAERFMRIHKSYIINISAVKALEGNRLLIEEYKIPISRARKAEVMKRILREGTQPPPIIR